MAPIYTISQLPKSFDDSADGAELMNLMVARFKSIRLESLQTNPEAFSSTHARELAFGPEIWQQRIMNPVARTFVAIQSNRGHDSNDKEHSSMTTLCKTPWIGMTTLLGPIVTNQGQMPFRPTIQFYDTFFRASSAMVTSEKQDEERGNKIVLYAINAVYISPPARGKGIAKRLLSAVLDAAKLDLAGYGTAQAICMCFVEKDNDAARALYLASGFEIAGEEDYVAYNGRNGSVYALIRSLTTV